MERSRSLRAAEETVGEEDCEEGGEGAGGIEEGVPGRGSSRGDERLVDFVEGGIGGSDEPGGEGPGPVPAGASAADSAKQEKVKDKVLREVSAFADEVVQVFELDMAEGVSQPGENTFEDGGGVGGGKGVRGREENEGGPEQGGPPSAEPCGEHRLRRDAGAQFFQRGSGARIAPGFG